MPDRLDAMHAFVAVCDARGFARAAGRLRLSPSVVTRLIAGLEEHLGVRLLQRTTRRVTVTDAGTRFLAHARRILAEVEEAESAVRDEQAQPRGHLVVAAPLLFGRLHVAPLLSRFLEANPAVSADLQLSDRFHNLVEDGIDIAIRIGDLADSGLVARRLGRTRRLLVASPGYLAGRAGPPRHPSDLRDHRLIGFRPLVPARSWSFRDPAGAVLAVDVQPGFSTDSGDAAIDRALAGGGITAAFCYQVDAALSSGALVELLAPFAPPAVAIQAVFPTSRLLSGKVRAFLDLAVEAASGWAFLRRHAVTD